MHKKKKKKKKKKSEKDLKLKRKKHTLCIDWRNGAKKDKNPEPKHRILISHVTSLSSHDISTLDVWQGKFVFLLELCLQNFLSNFFKLTVI